MDETLRTFLRDARLEEYEKGFVEKLEVKVFADLDEVDSEDLETELKMGKVARKRFARTLEEWKQAGGPEAKYRRRSHEAPAPSLQPSMLMMPFLEPNRDSLEIPKATPLEEHNNKPRLLACYLPNGIIVQNHEELPDGLEEDVAEQPEEATVETSPLGQKLSMAPWRLKRLHSPSHMAAPPLAQICEVESRGSDDGSEVVTTSQQSAAGPPAKDDQLQQAELGTLPEGLVVKNTFIHYPAAARPPSLEEYMPARGWKSWPNSRNTSQVENQVSEIQACVIAEAAASLVLSDGSPACGWEPRDEKYDSFFHCPPVGRSSFSIDDIGQHSSELMWTSSSFPKVGRMMSSSEMGESNLVSDIQAAVIAEAGGSFFAEGAALVATCEERQQLEKQQIPWGHGADHHHLVFQKNDDVAFLDRTACPTGRATSAEMGESSNLVSEIQAAVIAEANQSAILEDLAGWRSRLAVILEEKQRQNQRTPTPPPAQEEAAVADVGGLIVKNTFIDFPTERSCSLDEYLGDRGWRSCPASRMPSTTATSPEKQTDLETQRAAVLQEAFDDPVTTSGSSGSDISEEDSVKISSSKLTEEEHQRWSAAIAETFAQNTRPEPVFSLGSVPHQLGQPCRPCGFVHKPEGCENGANCPYCHLCPAGTLKTRKKAKKVMIRQYRQDVRQQWEAANEWMAAAGGGW